MNNERWLASVAMLCPVEHRDRACFAAAQFTGNPLDATPDFWSVPVYDSNEEIKYYLAHSRVRGVVLQYFPSLTVQFPGAQYILTQHDDYPEANYLSVDQWLESLGLHLAPAHDDELGIDV